MIINLRLSNLIASRGICDVKEQAGYPYYKAILYSQGYIIITSLYSYLFP